MLAEKRPEIRIPRFDGFSMGSLTSLIEPLRIATIAPGFVAYATFDEPMILLDQVVIRHE